MFIEESLLFSLSSFLFFYLPGNLLLTKLEIKLKGVQNFAASFSVGFLVFSYYIFLLRHLNLSFESIVGSFLAITLISFNLLRKQINTTFANREFLVFLFFATPLALLAGTVLFPSGILSEKGLTFFVGTNDPFFHLSLVNELVNHFPPQNPSFSGELLKNYHYMTDLTMAAILKVLELKIFDLYFRIFPFFGSILFLASVYALSCELTKRIWVRILSLGLVFLGGTFSYLVPLFIKGYQWSQSTFYIDQIITQILNPETYIGFALFCTGSLLVIKSQQSKSLSVPTAAAIIFACAFPIKAYASIVGFVSLTAVSCYVAIFKKNFRWLAGSIAAGIVLFVVFKIFITSSRNNLFFIPGWSLLVIVDRLGLFDSILKLEHWRTTGNYLRISEFYFIQTLIFLLGNLGARVLGVFYLIYRLLKEPFRVDEFILFSLTSLILSLGIPLIFNQGSVPYAIFEFSHYGLIISAIFTVIFIEKIYDRLKFNKIYLILAILFIFIISVPTSVKSIKENLSNEGTIINKDKLDALGFIAKSTDPDQVFLAQDRDTARYIAAIAGRRMYFSDLGTINLVSGSIEERERGNREFFKNYSFSQREEFIRKNSIKYVVTGGGYFECPPLKKYLTQVFVNRAYAIYQQEPIFPSKDEFLDLRINWSEKCALDNL